MYNLLIVLALFGVLAPCLPFRTGCQLLQEQRKVPDVVQERTDYPG